MCVFLMTGKPVAVTHSRGKGLSAKSGGPELTKSATLSNDVSFSSMAEIASCSYEARQVTCYIIKYM